MKKNRLVTVLAILGAILGASLPALAQQLTFSSVNITAGSGPVGMVPVDVNGDGYTDLVCADFGFRGVVYFGDDPGTGTTLSVFTNDGKGNLTLSSSPTVGLSPVVVAAADVNGDGWPDLISANVGDSTVTVLTNNGKGGFALSGTYAVGAGPSFVTAADVNGDGSVDLITANFQADTLTVLTNNGHGTFKLSATITAGSEPNCVAAADINGDGKLDLVCANLGESTLVTFTNNGRGVFSPAGTNTVASGLNFLVATDVNHDGTVDLVTAGGSTLNIFTNNGRGVFTLKSSPASAGSGVVATADFNGLGNVDLVCPNNTGGPGSATVLTNDGHGNFAVNTVVPVGTSGVDTYPNFVTAADFTGDGNADAAVSCFYDPGIITVLTQTNVASRPIVTITSPANDSVISATESFQITSTVTPGSNIAAVLYYVGTTILASSTNAPFTVQIPAGKIPAGTHALQAVAINSANHDGWSAEVQINVTSSVTEPPPTVKITAPATGATFTTTEGITVTTSDDTSVTEVQLHVDGQVFATATGAPFGFEIPAGALSPGNHALQAVAFNSESASASSAVVSIVVNEAVTALTFSNATLAVGSGPSFVLPVVINGVGLPDLVTPDYGFATDGCIGSYNGADGSNITVWVNNGEGAFSSDYVIPVGDPGLGPTLQPEPECIAAADFNNDGKTELISANFYYNTLNIFTNNGQGLFSLGTNVGDTARGPVFITTADVNGDGKPDLIIANDYDSEISVLTNTGHLAFAASTNIFVNYGACWIAVADFNGDGILDMACACQGSGCGGGDTVTVFLGDGHGGFTAKDTNTVGYGPECVAAADVNGDGKIDLITANEYGNSLTVLTNDGLGNFSLKATVPMAGPTCIVATNLSGNGPVDLAVANNGSSTVANGGDGKVTILMNDGLGNFAVSTEVTVGRLGLNSYYPNRIAAADFNGDGKMDLVVANYGADSLSVLTQISSQKLPVVTVTTPTNGESFPTNESFVVQAATSSSVSKVELLVDGQVAGQAASAPYTFPIAAGSLPAGSHTLQAVALTSQNFSASSPVIYVTLNTPGTALIDFDALNTSAGPVGGTLLASYLAGYGVTLTDVTAGTALEAVNTNSLPGSIQLEVPSAPNFFTQAGLDQPVSFTLVFATNIQSFGFTRVGLSAQSGLVSHPQWTATAFDSNGNELSSLTEGLILSPTNVPARKFVLTGEGIASVRFDSDSQQTAAFSAVLLDNLELNYNPTASLLSVTLSVVTPPTNDIVAPATITLHATVADQVSSTFSVSFFAGPALLGTATAPPYRVILTNVLTGNYDLQALAVDASGLAAESPVVPITVQLEPSSTVVDFDALNASRGPVEGTVLNDYLAGFGISIAGASPGTELAVESQQNIGGGAAVLAASPPNLLTQIGSNGPVQFTLRFAPLLSQFGFTRPELLANPFVSHPAWQVTALDGAGVVVDQVAEGQIDSATNVAAREFALSTAGGPGIAEVVFSSEGSGLTTFAAMLVDNFVLTTNKTGFPPAVAITEPVSGRVLAAPPALTVTAAAYDPAGIADVSFYASGTLIGTATTSPYTITWHNPTIGNHPLKAIASNVLGLTWTGPIVHIAIQPSAYLFSISSQPASQTIAAGASATFSVVTTGTNGVGYQWSFDGAPISGATSSTYVLKPPIQDANAGTYTVGATAGGTTLVSDPAVLMVVDPPTFRIQPQGQTVPPETDVTLTAAAAGTGPFTWRWLLNGTPIPGATTSNYVIAAAQPRQSGNYQVVVANQAASAVSAAASVIVETPITIPETNDDFANRASFDPLHGPVSDSNQLATLEPGEPLPDGLHGGKSIWFTWQATFTGTISLTTEGSDFETLLAVYTGTKLTALKSVAADKGSGGFLTSLVTFNVTEGTDYQIDVDGFQGADGRVVLGLPAGLSPALGVSVPVIVRGPASKTVAPNASATLTVEATSPTKMSYQWNFEGAPIAGATSSELVISHVQPGSVGMYDVLVDNAFGSARSEPAILEIGVNPGGAVSSTENEFFDAAASASPKEIAYVLHPVATGGDTRGYSVAQVFSTVGATREPDEPAPCGQIGGAALWFVYTAPAAGIMLIDTEGSSFNTLLGVYTGPGTSLSSLEEAGCGYTTNFSTDGQPTVILPDVAKGTTFYILVDGYQGATGVAQLHIGLGQALSFPSLPASQLVTAGTTATFDVTAIGSTPFSYQWQLNGVNVPGATTATCKIADAQEGAEGNYTVIVSNVIGAVTSSPPAVLTVQYAPDIVSGPSNLTVKVGQPAKFAVTALGVNVKTNPFVSQWYFDGAALTKATSLSLSIPVARLTNSGAYDIVISNTYGAVTSSPATLTVVEPAVSPKPAQRKSPASFPPAAAGTYSGLFYPANGATQANSGFLTATVATRGAGAFSANLLLDGGSYPFAGKFDPYGDAQSIVPRTGKPFVTATLHVDVDPPDGQLTGVISDADWSSILQAGRALFNAASNPAPVSAGQFALVIPSGAGAPVGYLTLTNLAGGTALVNGTLADGARIIRAAPMVKGAAIPLYAPLYSGKGLFLGWITFTNSAGQTNFDGAFWIKPGSTNATGVLIVK